MALTASGLLLRDFGDFTEIQKLAMPIISKGMNCLIVAPTGAGKTEAAMAPLLDRISAQGSGEGIAVIYITPLRALNRDMFKRLDALCGSLGISLAVRHGDTKQGERAKQVKRAPAVMITTPETFQTILLNKSFGNALKNVFAVVIDEIHELYSTKRGAQLCVGLERLELISGKAFQRVGISATVGDAETVRDFMAWGRECSIAQLKKAKETQIKIELPLRGGQLPESAVEKFGLDSAASARIGRIIELVSKARSTLIFANTRQVVEALGSRLLFINNSSYFGGIGVHHGSLNKEERIGIEDGFRGGLIKSVIATSSLELGIDIGSIDLVIQYGSPKQAVRLLQRVGRSGHREKRVSKGVVIATNIFEALESLVVYENALGGRMERGKVYENALDVLMHQVCGMLFQYGSADMGALHNILKKAYVYRNLGRKELDSVAEFMVQQRLAKLNGERIEAAPRIKLFYCGHVSFIPDSKRFFVKDIYTNRIISSLDERFVANSIEEGSVFITKGLPWKTVSIEEDSIAVEPSGEYEAAVPDWTGEDIPVSFPVAHNLFAMFSDKRGLTVDAVSADLRDRLSDFIDRQNLCFVPDPKGITIEEVKGHTLIYSPLGTLSNDAFSKILSYFIWTKFGRGIVVRASPYLILVGAEVGGSIGPFIRRVEHAKIAELLRGPVAESDIFRHKFVSVAKAFGVVEKDAVLHRNIVTKLVKVFRESVVYGEAMHELLHNYFDVGTLAEFLSELGKDGKEIPFIHSTEPSPLAEVVLESAYYTKELVMPLTPNSAALESFIGHAMKKRFEMLCTYCGFVFGDRLSDIKDMERISCRSCGSVMVVSFDEEYKKCIERRLAGKRGRRDRELFKNILKEASLFSSYGGKAAIALSTYGIGDRSAARILMMRRRDWKDFFLDLIEAQKQFIRTKKYWSAD